MRAAPVKYKLHPSLQQAINGPKHVKLEVQVWLTDGSAAAIEELKKLGFEVIAQPKSAKMVIGRITADKLDALSKLAVVTYVAPRS